MSPRATDHTPSPNDLPDDACWWDDEEWPEHDFPPEGEGDECRRCDAEAIDPERNTE